MTTIVKLGLAAALAFGVAAGASAGEGSPDLSYPPGQEGSTVYAPVAPWSDARNAYAQVGPAVSQNEQRWFDRATGSSDGV